MHIPDLSLEVTFKNRIPRFKLRTRKKVAAEICYNSDGLAVWGKSVDFLKDPRFIAAYQFGMNSGRRICRALGLTSVKIDRVSYLSIDMNIAAPEVAAMEFFWDKLVSGAPVVLDDYGWQVHREQKEALDAFARRKGVEILLLPTGQGLLLKP